MYRAFAPEHDRLVAIKAFTIDLAPDRAHRLVAEFERLIASDLTHPVMAVPLATGIQGVLPYLVLDYVPAESLDVAIRDQGPAPADEALRVATLLAGALDFAAAVHVLHGSLHPRDVLVSSDEVRLTGMGIAGALDSIGVTPPTRRPYVAPERIDAREEGREIDRRADIFSLAAVIYEVLSGRRVSGFGAQAADALPEIAGADRAVLQHAFARALAENPADRFGSGLEFAEALRKAIAGEEPVSTAVEPLPIVADVPPTLPVFVDEPPPVAAVEQHEEGEGALDTAPEPTRAQLPVSLGPEKPKEGPLTPSPMLMPRIDEPVVASNRPILLALMIGIALGFAMGYGWGLFEREPQDARARQPQSAVATTSAVPPAATGRDYTEGTVAASAPGKAAEPRAPVNPPPPPPRTPPEQDHRGRLLVRSTPAGARVFVDGQEQGETPATIRDLSPGAHRVRIVREGYHASERRVVLSEARAAQSLTFELERARDVRDSGRPQPTAATGATGSTSAPYSGQLVVDSRPTGATVFVDGRESGKTPLDLKAIAAGSHVVRLERDGYRLWSSSVSVVANERNRVTAALEK